MDHTVPHPELFSAPFATEEFNGMPFRCLGRSGLRVSNVGLGLWKIGYAETGDGSRTDEKTSFKMFDRAIELGVTFWDTANRYNNGSGNSERIIGKWFKKNPDQRRNVVLATKMCGGMDGFTPNHSHLSRLNIIESVKACLGRLQLDYIDVLYFHSPDPLTPAEESLATIEDLVSRDLIRYFALSNHVPDQIAAYQLEQPSVQRPCRYCFSSRSRVLAIQNQFDIVQGEAEAQKGTLAFAAKSGISYVAYSPLGRGLLTDKYLDKSKVGKGDRLFDEKAMDKFEDKRIAAKIKKLAALAHKWEMELSQLALAYMLTIPGMGPVIPSASSVKQVESNAAAGKIKLSDEQKHAVKAVVGY